jgi:hypothetical protein
LEFCATQEAETKKKGDAGLELGKGAFVGTCDDHFKQRGIENVKLQIKRANFAPEKDEAAR